MKKINVRVAACLLATDSKWINAIVGLVLVPIIDDITKNL